MKYLITATLIALSLNLKAQTSSQAHPIKKDSAKYRKLVTLEYGDYNWLLNVAMAYRNSVPWVQGIDDKDKPREERAVELYILNLKKTVKLDSVKVKSN